MALSQSDRNLLYTLQYSGDQPLSKISRSLRMKEGTVQSKVTRWIRSGEVQQRAFINTFKLGASEFEVYFSPRAKGRSSDAALKKVILGTPSLRWFYRLAGRYDFSLGLEARALSPVAETLESLDAKLPGLFSRKEIGGAIGYWWFGRRYLGPKSVALHGPIEMTPQDGLVDIDEVDHRILQLLGSQHLVSSRDMARSLGLPQSTVAYRVKRLTSCGVIAGTPYLPSTSWLGVRVFRILLAFRCFSNEAHRRLFSWARQQRSLVSMLRVLGNWDYTLRFEVYDAEDVVGICDNLQDLFVDELERCEVVSVVKEHAFITYPHAAIPGRR